MRVGNLVEVTFRDHVEHARRSVRCVVWGRVAAIDTQVIVVRCWHAAFRSARDRQANSTEYTILRSAVEKIRRLEARGA